MLKQELTISHELEGFNIAKLDGKRRFNVPTEWRNIFGSIEFIILYTGNYGIIVEREIFEKTNIEPGVIVHTTHIDESGRIMIPIHYVKGYGITLEKTVSMIGRGNHIEIYFQNEKFVTTKARALQSAVAYQAEYLLGSKK